MPNFKEDHANFQRLKLGDTTSLPVYNNTQKKTWHSICQQIKKQRTNGQVRFFS